MKRTRKKGSNLQRLVNEIKKIKEAFSKEAKKLEKPTNYASMFIKSTKEAVTAKRKRRKKSSESVITKKSKKTKK